MSRRTEIEVGLTVLVALAILIVGVTWLKEFTIQRSVKKWHVLFPQTGGLGKGDEVQVNGIKKGSVDAVHLGSDGVVVDLAIASEVTLTHDSRVTIRNIGLMGEKVIGVDLRSTGGAWSVEDTIPGGYEKGIPEVMGDVAITIETVTELSTKLSTLIASTDKSGDLSGTLRSMRKASDELAATVQETRGVLRSSLTDFAATAKTTRKLTTDREAQLGQAITDFSSAADKLDRLSGRLDSLSAVVQSVTNKVDRGDGTLGKLVNDRRLYTDMSSTIDSLRVLIADFKKNPKRYVKLSIF
ncbi:MAG TPA: MlaD family protein [Candidatus Eisenbacteria bacterium]|nr:MlaD family protein [Candidatus Eisenbacteria bacterium]